MWCAHCLILCLVSGLIAAASTKNDNTNLNLDKIFRTPKDYSNMNFDHFEIVERNNFADDAAAAAKEEAKETKSCTNDKSEQKTRCTANANAKITVRFGGDHRVADKHYFYGPPPPATLPGILPLPAIAALHEGYFHPYMPPPRGAYPVFYPGYSDVPYKRCRNYDDPFYSRYTSLDSGQHVTKKGKTSESNSDLELGATPKAAISNSEVNPNSNRARVLHIGNQATTIPNAILFTGPCKEGETDSIRIPDVIVHTTYPSPEDENVAESTKKPRPQSSDIQVAADDTFLKGHPKILKAWMLKKKGISNEKVEEVVNATDSIYDEALKKIGAILLHLQTGGEKECGKDDMARWLNASLVPYKCRGCDCDRKLLVSYPINGERANVECVSSENSSVCSCKPCSCGDCSRDPSIPYGKRFRADEDTLHKMTKQIKLSELQSVDTMKHPKAKAVLHAKGIASDTDAVVEKDLDKIQNEILGELLIRKSAKRSPADVDTTNKKLVNEVDGSKYQGTEQLVKRVVKREVDVTPEDSPFGEVDQKRDEVEVAKLAATEPTPRKFVKGSDKINQSDAPQLDKHLAKRENTPFRKADEKRGEVEVAKLAATEPTPRKFVKGSDKINQSDAPQLDKHLAKREDSPFEKDDEKRGEVEVAKLAATEPTPRKFVKGSDKINQSDAPQLDKHLAKREDSPFEKDDEKRGEVEVAKLAATEPTPRKFVKGSDKINQSDAPQLDKHLAKREDSPFEKDDEKRGEVEVAKLAATEPTPRKFVKGSDKINQSDAPQLDKHLAKREDSPFEKDDEKRGEVEVAKLAATEPTPRKFVKGSDKINQSDAPQLDKHLAKREDSPFEKDDEKRGEVEVAKLAATEPTPRKFVKGSDKINQSDAPQLDKHLAKRENTPFRKADEKRGEVEVAKLAATEPTPRKFVKGSDKINQSDAPQLDKHLAKRENTPFRKADEKRGEVEVAKLAATEPTPRKFVKGSDKINQSDAPQLDKHLAKREDSPFEKDDEKRGEVEVAKLAATEPTPRKFVKGSDKINQSDAPQLDKHLAKRKDSPFEKDDEKRGEVEVAKLAATEPTPRKFVKGSDKINQSDAPQLDKHLAKREDSPFEKDDEKRGEVEVAKLAATEPTPRKFVKGSDKINQSDAPQLDKHLAKREDSPFEKDDEKRGEVEVAKLAATEPTPRKFVKGSDKINQSDAPQLDKHLAKREDSPFEKDDEKRGEVEVAKLAATEPTPRKFVKGSDKINQSDAPQLDKHLAKRENTPFRKDDEKRGEVEVAKLAATEPTPRKFVKGSDKINQSDAPQLDKHLAKREDSPFEKDDEKRGEVEVAKLAATEPTPRKFVKGSDKINQSDAPQLDKHLAKREDSPFEKDVEKRGEVEVAKLAATEPTPRKFVKGSDKINQSDAPQLDKHLAKREDSPFEKDDEKRGEVEVAKLAATEPTPRKFVKGSDKINQSDAPQLDKHLAKREDSPFEKDDEKRGEVEVAKLAATEPTPRKFVKGSDKINQSDAPQLDKHLAKREDSPFEKDDEKRGEVEVAKLAATEPTPRKFVKGSDKINQSDAPQLDKHLAKREDSPFEKDDEKRGEVEVAKLAATEPTPRKFVKGSDKINQSDAPQLDKHLAKRENTPFGEVDQKRDKANVAKLAATEPTPRRFVPGSDQINQSDAPQLDMWLGMKAPLLQKLTRKETKWKLLR